MIDFSQMFSECIKIIAAIINLIQRKCDRLWDSNAYLGSKSFVILGSNKQTGDADQLESVQGDSLIGQEPVHQFNSQVQSLLGELLVNLENQDRFRYYVHKFKSFIC